MTKTVVITGVHGQDGSILAQKYLARGYKVYGLIRHKASGDIGCLEHVPERDEIELIEGDVTDLSSLIRLCKYARPDIFINAAAQSHVGLSFQMPEYTMQATGHGVVNCLEAIKICEHDTRFLQLSSSEMFGGVGDSQTLLDENSPMIPKSPYAAAKLLGYNTTKVYRESYGMHASNSICFNHEEPGRRGKQFVTRKICLGIVDLLLSNFQTKIQLGNLKAKRDWGLASDYCDAMMLILDHDTPDDYVIATGETYSIEDFLQEAFDHIEVGPWQDFVQIDSGLYRPNEVHTLIGDYSKIKNKLGWKPTCKFKDLVIKMLAFDLNAAGIEYIQDPEPVGLKVLGRPGRV